MPIEDGVRRLREGLFAFHMETGSGYKLVGWFIFFFGYKLIH